MKPFFFSENEVSWIKITRRFVCSSSELSSRDWFELHRVTGQLHVVPFGLNHFLLLLKFADQLKKTKYWLCENGAGKLNFRLLKLINDEKIQFIIIITTKMLNSKSCFIVKNLSRKFYLLPGRASKFSDLQTLEPQISFRWQNLAPPFRFPAK